VPEFDAVVEVDTVRARRKVVVDAVAALLGRSAAGQDEAGPDLPARQPASTKGER
jgi:hypothetical protein